MGVAGEGGPRTRKRGTEHYKGGGGSPHREKEVCTRKGGLRARQRVKVPAKGAMDRRGKDMVHSASQKAIEGTALHRLQTYKSWREVKFTNALLAMLEMALLSKRLWMTAD